MTVPPIDLTVRPNLEYAGLMDPLSAIVRSVRFSGGIFIDAQFSAPWSITSQVTAEDCRLSVATPAQMVAYHFVIEGRLVASVDGEPAMEVNAGEAILFPRNDRHALASSPGLPSRWAREFIKSVVDGEILRISHGGGGEPVHIVCGFLATELPHNPLFSALPSMLKLDVREGASRDWVEASLRFAASELANGRLSSSDLISKLSELLLVEAMRDYAATLDPRETGWLRGISDPQIGRALVLIHTRSATPWTAAALAREVALSRSAFVERFTSLIGVPPIRYLTTWRLQNAKLALRETVTTIAQLAHSVGYESEEAFSRAFKREFGEPPARWRDRQARS